MYHTKFHYSVVDGFIFIDYDYLWKDYKGDFESDLKLLEDLRELSKNLNVPIVISSRRQNGD